MTIQHSAITDPDLHEPKGIAAASAKTIYVADGAGSGTWELAEVIQYITVSATMADVSAAGSIYIPVPNITGLTLVGASLTLGGAITVADASVTFFNSSSASLGSAVTIVQASSAAGSTFQFTATTNTALTGGTYIRVTSDGASTTTSPMSVVLLMTKTVNNS